MRPALSHKSPFKRLLGIAVILWLWAVGLGAHEVESLRINAGIDLFPSFVAADLDIADKAGRDGALLLLLVHRDAEHHAEHLADALAEVDNIRGLPVRVRIVSVDELAAYRDARPAAVFVTERLAEAFLRPIVAFGRQTGVLVISPHEGDVDQGASGGIWVGDRILPYVNMRALDAGGIRLKPFFLRIAEKYED